jgi:hypothetical protein
MARRWPVALDPGFVPRAGQRGARQATPGRSLLAPAARVGYVFGYDNDVAVTP